jgi:hypothetical protein
MANQLTLTQTQQGWILKMPADMATVLGAAEGSLLMLYAKPEGISTEILPPTSPELKASVRRICEKYKDDFEEMKRFGD